MLQVLVLVCIIYITIISRKMTSAQYLLIQAINYAMNYKGVPGTCRLYYVGKLLSICFSTRYREQHVITFNPSASTPPVANQV